MRNFIIFQALTILIVLAGCSEDHKSTSSKLTPVDFSYVQITDSFWSRILTNHVNTTLPVCIDQIENKSDRIRNFENAALGEGEHSGIFYDDSDVYKALEGIAYSLINNPNPDLEKKADEWIDKFTAAQEDDGYINTYYSLTGLDKRWTNMDKHEMYCAGHLIEAAVAYYKATEKKQLLDVSINMVDHIMGQFGPDKRHWVPGHEEIELALVKLYEVTGNSDYLNFAHWLLEERGHGHGTKGEEGEWNTLYYQDSVPVKELSQITGHAVRAMYLFCAMADVETLKENTGYLESLERLWDDVVNKKMYITGGIGSSRQNEGFTEPYDLPNYEAYCETCASVGMVYWNSRMNQLTRDSKYADVMERSLYNGALAGVSLNGDRFFYVNPLASHGDHHRKEWYGTACCPSQISRFIPSIGNYIYGISYDALWVNLYIGNNTRIPMQNGELVIKQETNYPWDGEISLTIESLPKGNNLDINLRIPDWCKYYSISVNGDIIREPALNKGYVILNRNWRNNDKIYLSLDMPVKVITDIPQVKENIGKKAVQRGPLIYCAEETDNIDFQNIFISDEITFTAYFEPDILNGITLINAQNDANKIKLIPYYAWDNREAGEMKMWINYEEKKVVPTGLEPVTP
ncbi:MAG: glycoside hydrolase family 127 protein [Bacteroidales bacterium]|nr:glycoside hydrolase family 127 protein [Bacteroidales bacterium]